MQYKKYYSLGVFLIIFTSSALHASEVHSEHHDSAEKSAAALQLDHGKKWKTDGPLRSGMSAIQKLVRKNLSDVQENKLKDDQYEAFSDAIDVQVALIFKNCKLSPKADEMLHLVLVQVIQGSAEMKGAHPTLVRKQGALKVSHALVDYGRFFAHTGWKS